MRFFARKAQNTLLFSNLIPPFEIPCKLCKSPTPLNKLVIHEVHDKVTKESKRLTTSNTVTWCNYKVSFQLSFQLNYNSKGDNVIVIKTVALSDVSANYECFIQLCFARVTASNSSK